MSNLSGKKVLLTGAGGFIGSRLASLLIRLGADVKAFVRYNSRADAGLLALLPKDELAHLQIIFGDLRDTDAVGKSMGMPSQPFISGDTQPVDIVFHLGALISIPYSYLHPVETIETNILGTLNILQACRNTGSRLIHTSTSEVYGSALRVPIDETHPLQGQSPYSASKIGADKLVESYYRSYGVQAVTIRPFNTFGPGQSARAVIPTIITQALAKNELLLGNLETKRDFTFLDDTVDGFITAAEVLLDPQGADHIVGQEINLGTGVEVSIAEVTQIILKLTGKENLPIRTDHERLRPEKSEVLRLLSDNSKAQALLGWSPQVSLEEGLVQTIDWIRQHQDLYRTGTYER